MLRPLTNIAAPVVLGVLLPLGAAAGTRTPPTPASSPQRTAALVEGFEHQVDADRNALGIPGLSMVVIQDGRILSARGFGYADVERRIPATADTLYHLASVTKTFTAILVWRLVEQGRLDLDEPMSHYSPDFKDDSVRIKHLLSHTSESTPPGDRFAYSPTRFEYLKAVLEKKTGKPLRQLFVETFLDPLGMHDSVPGPDVADDDTTWAVLGRDHLARYRQVLPRLAKPYTYWGDGEAVYSGYPERDFWASAGLLSTVRDMAKYDIAVDQHVLLEPDTLARAWTPFASSTGERMPMGLGWWITDYRGERLVWHYGHWGTGFSALYLKVPARHLTFVALANSEALADHHYQLGDNVTNDIFACDFLDTFVPGLADDGTAPESLDVPATGPATDCVRSSRTALRKWIGDRRSKARTAVPLDPALASEYAGHYKFSFRTVTITAEGGHVYIDVPEGERSELLAETPTRFFLKIRPWTLTFVREGAKGMRLDVLYQGQILSGRRID